MARPATFDDIHGNAPTKAVLSSILGKRAEFAGEAKIIPPVLLAGPYGTGKTSLANLYAAGWICAEPLPCGTCTGCTSVHGRTAFTVTTLHNPSEQDIRDLWAGTRMSRGPLTHVVIVEDVDLMPLENSVALARVLDTVCPKVAFVLTAQSFAAADPSLRSICLPLATAPLTYTESVDYLKILSGGSLDEETASRIVRAAEGVPRQIGTLYEAHTLGGSAVDRPDTSRLLLRAVAQHNLEGGVTVIDEYFEDGGTYPEAVADLQRALSRILEYRATGTGADTDTMEISGALSDGALVALMRTVWQAPKSAGLADPVDALRTLYVVLVDAAAPGKFVKDSQTVEQGETVDSEKKITADDLLAIFGENSTIEIGETA